MELPKIKNKPVQNNKWYQIWQVKFVMINSEFYGYPNNLIAKCTKMFYVLKYVINGNKDNIANN